MRIKLSIADGKPPTVVDQTVVGSGFGSQPNKDVFVIGPTGLALGADGTLYVSDATGNRINAIWDATTRDHSAGVGRTITKDGLLQTPLAMADGAERASSRHQRVERAGGGGRSGERRADQGAVDRSEQGAKAAGQRRFVRHRDDAGRRRILLRRGRGEHVGARKMSCPFAPGGTGPSRRGLLVGAGGLLAGAGVGERRARRLAGGLRRRRAAGAVLWRASRRHRDSATDAQLLRRLRPRRQDARRGGGDAARLDRSRGADDVGRDGSPVGRGSVRRRAGRRRPRWVWRRRD